MSDSKSATECCVVVASPEHLHQKLQACCGDSGHGHISRQFIGNEERIEHLENYRDQIQKELKGVEEAIGKAKKS
ncbi:MAG TPA: hypothetical protein VGB30_03200 [bacterium]|jgi:hypothetical protein